MGERESRTAFKNRNPRKSFAFLFFFFCNPVGNSCFNSRFTLSEMPTVVEHLLYVSTTSSAVNDGQSHVVSTSPTGIRIEFFRDGGTEKKGK